MFSIVGVQAYAEEIKIEKENKISNPYNGQGLNAELKNLESRLKSLEENYRQERKVFEEKTTAINSRLESIGNKSTFIEESLANRHEDQSRLETELKQTISDLRDAKNSIERISIDWSQASNIAKLGALILLCGLLIEIIGATVLAGTHLISKQENVFTLKSTPPSLDLSLNDVNTEPRINFLGSLASILLFLGFVLQFSGTILVLSLPSWLTVLMVTLSIIPGSLIIYYLLGQSYNQSRSEKLKIVIKNIRRNFIPEFGLKCDFCSNKVNLSKASIWWRQESNSDTHPYLHVPCYMHIGHEPCLEVSDDYKDHNERHTELANIDTIKVSVQEFIDKKTPELRKWWKEYRAYWAKERGSDETMSDQEYQFEQLIKRVGK